MEETKNQQAQEERKPYKEARLQVFHYDEDVICDSCPGEDGCPGAVGCDEDYSDDE